MTMQMVKRLTWFLLLLAATGLCQESFAQMRGHHGSSVSVHRVSNLNNGPGLQTAFPVPGFGFDYVHLAAVNPGAFSSPVIGSSHLTRFSPVTLPFFPQPAQIIIVQQPPVVIVQPPPAAEESPEWPPRSRSPQREEAREPERPPILLANWKKSFSSVATARCSSPWPSLLQEADSLTSPAKACAVLFPSLTSTSSPLAVGTRSAALHYAFPPDAPSPRIS